MDLNKICPGRTVTYRIPSRRSDVTMGIIERLETLQKGLAIGGLDMLDFLTILWLEKQASEAFRRPKTPAEKNYVRRMMDSLDKQIPENVMKSGRNINAGLHKEIMPYMKEALVSMFFGALTDSALKSINDKFGTEGE